MFLLFIIFAGLFLFSIWPLFLEEITNDKEDYDLLNTLERRKSIFTERFNTLIMNILLIILHIQYYMTNYKVNKVVDSIEKEIEIW